MPECLELDPILLATLKGKNMFGFLIALVAGFLTPQLQASIAPVVAKTLAALDITEKEHDVLGFMIALLGAGFLASLFGNQSPFSIAVGVVVGYFATRLLLILQNMTKSGPKS